MIDTYMHTYNTYMHHHLAFAIVHLRLCCAGTHVLIRLPLPLAAFRLAACVSIIDRGNVSQVMEKEAEALAEVWL
jgi:hypothetical protein